jgi:hypothetical protein
LLLYVTDTDALEVAERDELRAHLASGCPACAGALAEAQATVAQLPQALPRVPPPAGARDRLMQRVLADASSGSSPGATGSAPNLRALRLFASIASVAAMIAIGAAIYFSVVAKRNETLASTWEKTTRSLNSQVTLVSLEKMPPQPNARGRVVWDRDSGMWHVSVFDMMPPPPGKGYELWFITPSKPVRAGMITVDAKGNGSMMVPVPKDIGPIASAAFTDEPLGGVDAPTGAMQLKGDVR